MDCGNRGGSRGKHKIASGKVNHFYECRVKSIGLCSLKPTDLTSGGKPIAVCSAQCPFFQERVVPEFWKVDVVVTSHNYGRFLEDALDSVTEQHLVGQVIVVDDASDSDDPTKAICEARGVRYIRTEFKSPHLARGIGLAECSSPLVCFLDADNQFGDGYLFEAAKLFGLNPKLAVVYPDLRFFGDKHETLKTPHFDMKRLEQVNFIDTGAVWRTEAIRQQFAFSSDPSGLEDWRLARSVMRSGEWEASKNPIALDYRKHGENRLDSGVFGDCYFDMAGLADETVTIFTTFSGRIQKSPELWERRKEWLRNQTWPRIRLVVANTSHQPMPEGWDSGLPSLEGISVYSHPVGSPGLEDQDRAGSRQIENDVSTAVAAIYNRMWQETRDEFVLVLEDDVFPHRNNAIEALMRTVDQHVCAVTGKYRQRYYPYAITAWSATPENGRPKLKLHAPDTGIASIDGSGFGCVLLRRSQVADEVIIANSPISPYYDVDLFKRLKSKGLKVRINYGVDCDHAGVKMPPPRERADKLTVMLPTIGRESLTATLHSIQHQLADGDEVWLLSDGPASAHVRTGWHAANLPGELREIGGGPHGDWGHTPRNRTIPDVKSGYIVSIDDDDALADGALAAIRKAIKRYPSDFLIFQMRAPDGKTLPNGDRIESGNVGTPMFVFPAGVQLGQFAPVYGGDFDFIRDTIAANPERSVRWVPEVIVDIRPDKKQQPMRGLGDLVAKGIEVATLGMVKPCGKCKERQAKLNQLVPFRGSP